jgi:hypothetical protein
VKVARSAHNACRSGSIPHASTKDYHASYNTCFSQKKAKWLA